MVKAKKIFGTDGVRGDSQRRTGDGRDGAQARAGRGACFQLAQSAGAPARLTSEDCAREGHAALRLHAGKRARRRDHFVRRGCSPDWAAPDSRAWPTSRARSGPTPGSSSPLRTIPTRTTGSNSSGTMATSSMTRSSTKSSSSSLPARSIPSGRRRRRSAAPPASTTRSAATSSSPRQVSREKCRSRKCESRSMSQTAPAINQLPAFCASWARK